MPLDTSDLAFDQASLADRLALLADPEVHDTLPYGVIGFGADGQVSVYNRHESQAAGLSPRSVLGRHLFLHVAPCMNNGVVAGRFAEATHQRQLLDLQLPYVLSLRMRPTKVRLRLLQRPDMALRFVLIARR